MNLLLMASLIVLLPDYAYAQYADSILCIVAGFFTGGVGKAIGTIAVAFLGVQALLGKISWGMCLLVAIGIAGMYGAVSIVASLTGISSGHICYGYV